MTVFYWVMSALIVATLVPSVLFFVLFAATGSDVALRRARGLWAFTRVLALFGVNLLIWGHVVVVAWQVFRN